MIDRDDETAPPPSWHNQTVLLRDLLHQNREPEFRALLDSTLKQANSKFFPASNWWCQINGAGQPFTAMGQTDLGGVCMAAGAHWHDLGLTSLGHQMFAPALVRRAAGGLLGNVGDWLHGSTGGNPDGTVLNKHLIAARNLLDGGRLSTTPAYVAQGKASIECLTDRHQLGPNLFSFIVRSGVKKTPNKRSWLGYDLSPKGKPAFLKQPHPWKDGHYSLFVVDLLYRIERYYPEVDMRRFHKPLDLLAGKSIVEFLNASIRKKGDIYKDSVPASGGCWAACTNPPTLPLSADLLAWLSKG